MVVFIRSPQTGIIDPYKEEKDGFSGSFAKENEGRFPSKAFY